MSDQSNNGAAQLRQDLAALDSSIADLRLEADRLRASAKARSTLALLERAATPTEPPVWEDSAPVFAPDYVPQHLADDLASDAVGEEAPGETSPATAEAAPVTTERNSEDDGNAEAPDVGATVLEFPAQADAVSEEVAGFFAEPLSQNPEDDETSPLAAIDEDVEAAFDKFFSADVEPEPAQRWLLNE